MVQLRFRALRKLWLASIALTSLACIVVSLSLYGRYNPKADVCVLVAVPALCLMTSLSAIFAKQIFRSSIPHCVAIECIWTACLVPFDLILSLYGFSLRNEFVDGPAHMQFLVVQVLCWLLTALVFSYCSLIVDLSFLTAFTLDKDVWFRDITDSPSPFPLYHIVFSLRQSLCRLFGTTSAADEQPEKHTPHCLPGCDCNAKIAPSSPPSALPPIGFLSGQSRGDSSMSIGSARTTVPVRVPTAMERHNSIVVGFEV
ncbi:hypothetical protein BV25DRAFT_1994530 [Artomyces pyxidatus]|uniref:Uncharacterized protein n=1 Tax=Artomyces pyxidatus TaxID=48021 RepID=A0ACB8SNG1_9AGAM|nr:hypothetical protein BV25DRAFT_1994530 [Artomyces pyxidatus]